MKRYRVLHVDFDTRAHVLNLPIQADWEPGIQEQWRTNQEMVRGQVVAQYGPHRQEAKLRNFADLGSAPFSVVAYHNAYLRQARDAFVIGAYYPSLTAVCALGERVLHHLVNLVRDDFKGTPEHGATDASKSPNWPALIDALSKWDMLLPATADLFRHLRKVRNEALHFNRTTDESPRDAALNAIRLFNRIVEEQFAAFGLLPWFIPNDIGLTFVRKSFERHRFVAHVVLPSCALVGPAHDVEVRVDGLWRATDPTAYPEAEVTDDEFIALFVEAHRAPRRPSGG